MADPSMARYAQVKQHLLDGMTQGRWLAGARLPSESELVAEFGLSRMTVNRALRELAAEGRIERIAGVGSFVAAKKPQATLLQIASIANDIRARGHDYVCDVLEARKTRLPADAVAQMNLTAGANAFYLLCLHRENGMPVQLEERWVNPAMAPEFLEQDWAETTPGDYLVAHVPYDEIEHLVDAVLPDPAQAQALDMHAQEPCLLLSRRTFNDGQVVTWVRCLHPAGRYRLGSRFPRHAP